MSIWEDKPMPDVERRVLSVATALVWLFALAVNVDHVEQHLHSGGASAVETEWLRWAPDVLLLVGAWKLRYRPRSIVAWSMLVVGVAWLVWAALSMATPTATGRIVSLLPIAVALLMTLALEFKERRQVVVETPPAPEPTARPRRPRAEPRNAPAPAPSEPVGTVPEQGGTVGPIDDAEAHGAAEHRSADEADLDRIVRPLALAGKGRDTARAALAAEGLSCANKELSAYLKAVKEARELDSEPVPTAERTQA